MYSYHPEIEGLKTNEDGTEVLLNGKLLESKPLKLKGVETEMLYIVYNGQPKSVPKLVCECWHGMADNPRWVATRKEMEKGFHYTNLYFTSRGKNPSAQKNRNFTRSKIKKDDVPIIKKRLSQGDTLKAIAKDYNTSQMSIQRLKK